MAILDLTDDSILQEVLYMLDPSLTFEEVPREVITARPVLRSANRFILQAVGMTEAEYDALDPDDIRREIFEEVAVRYGTYELIPVVAQLVVVNANGLLTRFQEIDWKERRNQLYASITDLLDPFLPDDSGIRFFGAVSAESRRAL